MQCLTRIELNLISTGIRRYLCVAKSFVLCFAAERVGFFLITWDVLPILFCDHNLFDRLKSFFTRNLCLNLKRHSQFFIVVVLSAYRKKISGRLFLNHLQYSSNAMSELLKIYTQVSEGQSNWKAKFKTANIQLYIKL